MTRDAEGLAQAVRSLHTGRGEALAYLTKRIMTLESTKPNSPRLPELRATHREIEANREKYE